MFRFIKNLKSLFCYIAILIYYDALFFCSKIPILNIFIFPLRVFSVLHKKKSNGERLCIAFHRMGPTFIKLGQFLSVRSDLVGNKIANDLTKLQDDLPAAKFYKINGDTKLAGLKEFYNNRNNPCKTIYNREGRKNLISNDLNGNNIEHLYIYKSE